jgi:Protein of unknown function (DUF998)
MAGVGGTDRWIMTLAMLLGGGSYLLTAVGMAGLWRPARLLLMVAGFSSLGIATSPEPASGPTAVHLGWTVLGAAAITIWPAVAVKHAPPQLLLLIPRYTIVVTLVLVAMLGWVVVETQGGATLGLAERLLTTTATACPFVVAVLLRRPVPGREAAGEPVGAGRAGSGRPG